ncbi:MAG: 16S rRNA (adenine(1518)-N(6)/adenine(1519)-N(6))-dimethyltransferase RsmA [Ectothiorhodospiraceae bacterium]|nr:16S rRNA (adenine(1518)-N(6)/adenine(1519)-N(6))-dimethyltransferase RsmA [Ectothiorhodospiraceae bacterium]MCH8505444.1 16S rRNA (adenine(1518)-N(6)/adenine(1519)-N(6))-dimethyltransferase RsmA [Ectothiorhodospiraceae bacterium]
MEKPPHRPRKRFGQNFLQDSTVIDRILAAVRPSVDDRLVEIGPGQGALTMPLLAEAGRLVAVEMDRDLIDLLQQRCAPLGDLTLIQGDALDFDFRQAWPEAEQIRVVGNLPYNISTPLLFHVMEAADRIRDMHFMLQREVVERMRAPPGSKTYGRLSVMVQYRCAVERLFVVPPGAFFPPPKVESAVVRLRPRAPDVVAADETLFARLVAQAFSQRRKTLRNTLRGLADERVMEVAGVDPGARPEQLSVSDFVALCNAAGTMG